MSKNTLIIIGIVFFFGIIGFMVGKNDTPDHGEVIIDSAITTFQQCVTAGGHVVDSRPRACHGNDGRTFTELPALPQPTPPVGGDCARAGCSSQLCVEAKDAPNTVTTCEYRESYGCYREAVCERQKNGQCGFTDSVALKICLEKI